MTHPDTEHRITGNSGEDGKSARVAASMGLKTLGQTLLSDAEIPGADDRSGSESDGGGVVASNGARVVDGMRQSRRSAPVQPLLHG
jgi:hypothetical protein